MKKILDFLATKKGFFMCLGLSIAWFLIPSCLGFWQVFNLAGADTLILTLIVWIVLVVLSLFGVVRAYLLQADKEVRVSQDYENMKTLNKQMFSDILKLESEITRLENELKEARQ